MVVRQIELKFTLFCEANTDNEEVVEWLSQFIGEHDDLLGGNVEFVSSTYPVVHEHVDD